MVVLSFYPDTNVTTVTSHAPNRSPKKSQYSSGVEVEFGVNYPLNCKIAITFEFNTMSGTFGYDGYIYQANVALYLIVQKILNHEGLDRFELELRKVNKDDSRKDEFTVDLLLLASTTPNQVLEQKCDVVEIKGGNQANLLVEDIQANLSLCSQMQRAGNAGLIITQKLILRKQEENVTIDGTVIEKLEDDINDDTQPFTTLENRTIAGIKAILKTFIGTQEIEYRTRVIFYSLRHLIEYKIKKLAHDLRENETPIAVETAVCTVEELFDHQESFTHTLQNVNHLVEAEAREKLNNFNKMPRASSTISQAEHQMLVSPTGSGENL